MSPRSVLLPSPLVSDFFGSVYLTLMEAEIQFKPVEPRNVRVDLLGPQLGRQILVMQSQLVRVGSVVICYDDCVVLDPHVPFESCKAGRGHVLRVPVGCGRDEPLAKLI